MKYASAAANLSNAVNPKVLEVSISPHTGQRAPASIPSTPQLEQTPAMGYDSLSFKHFETPKLGLGGRLGLVYLRPSKN